ncbi:MAG: PSD1 and planctomycete cytochrome C domain-containing protein [Fuerstiella sp.]
MSDNEFRPCAARGQFRQSSAVATLTQLCVFWLILASPVVGQADEDGDSEHFFETKVRPLLVAHCVRCHGAEEQNGGLRLDTRASLMRGGDSGPAAVPGAVDRSLIIRAVAGSDELSMPPDEKLTAEQIHTLQRWVAAGLPWPDTAHLQAPSIADADDHWAFQPSAVVSVPSMPNTTWPRNAIDAFILRALQQNGLSPAPRAKSRDLVRRLSHTLTGLPPTPEDVRAFVAMPDEQAYERLVDQYLAAPEYGQHWARHWLDVARYSDTKGYVYAREERFWTHAWRYRDWVVDALNEDLPYDRFLLLQLAADQVDDARHSDLAAMGFLTVGRRFLGVERDIIDDRIDVVTRGTMGLTVSCARCHDHKYDPIPTADYYSLYGVFDSCVERTVRLSDQPMPDDYEAELKKRQTVLQERLAQSRAESSARVRGRIRDYLVAQTELHKYPPKGFDQVFQKSDLLPAFVSRWAAYLRAAQRRQDPVFVPWHLYRELDTAEFAARAPAVTQQIHDSGAAVNPIVAAAFAMPPADFSEVIDRYAEILTEIDRQWAEQQTAAKATGKPQPTQLAEAAAEQLRAVLYGPAAPCEVPDEPIVHTESFFDSGTCTALWKLQGDVDRWLIEPAAPPEVGLILTDREIPSEPRIFRRGNPMNPGEDVPRRFLKVLSPAGRTPFETGSGRLELAQAIVAEDNPLTARVIVNRVWAQHFGRGLVPTPSDFGLRASAPSHPELLDWLTTEFRTNGWSLKWLHRMIVTSATFQQSASRSDQDAVLPVALEVDPENRLLWRMNSRRLTFEQFRDAMLTATGELNTQRGGKPAPLFDNPTNVRRTLYGLVDRQFLPSILRVFDFANPDLHVPQRNQTTVPQQALFFMNHPLVLDRARRLAEVVSPNATPERMVIELFQRVLLRHPTADERRDAVALLSAVESDSPTLRPTAADWSFGFGGYNEQSQRVENFQPLPHFTGAAWQGGPAWPDPKLGWVQLSAVGGHPGNTRDTACVRRWTAPADMTVRIESRLVHERAAGDGVRAFVVSSVHGQLATAAVHQSSASLDIESLTVTAGETIDFVVDINNVLNSDEHLWKAVISATPTASSPVGTSLSWDSTLDFTTNTGSRLTPAEQLAQILFCSNEFLFVD